MGEVIRVGMSDMNVCKAPDSITTLGLGSCVGVVLYDETIQLAGMVHVMLPDSRKISQKTLNVAKFADTGIRALYEKIVALGANRNHIKAKIAGGAQMFAFQSENDLLRIGEKNIEATKVALLELNIPIVAQDTGLNYGRTIEFDPKTCELKIRSVGKVIKSI